MRIFALPAVLAIDVTYPEDEIDGILEIKEEVKLKHMTLEQQKHSLSIIYDKIDVDRNAQLDKENGLLQQSCKNFVVHQN